MSGDARRDGSGAAVGIRDAEPDVELRDELQRFRSSMDQASDAVFWLGRDGRFTYVNEQACRSLGYTDDELRRMSLWDIDPDFSKEMWAQKWDDPDTVSAHTIETTHRRKDGSVFPVEVSAKHIRLRDGELHVAFVRDISARRKAEEERLELERRLLHAQKLESLGVLSGGIAHDFNNLLLAILGNLELASERVSAEAPAQRMIQRAIQASHRAADLTRQMLAYSGRGRFVVRRLNLNELVEENAHLLQSSMTKNVILKIRLRQGIPQIEADPGQIQQVIMNLITNASEAIGREPGVVTLETGVRDCDEAYLSRSRVDRSPAAGSFVYLAVTDTGVGMSRRTRQRLFDPFFTTKATGRGLGMSAILGIVRGHGGAILVDSEPGHGSTIRTFFPAMEISKPESARTAGAPASATETAAGTVLVVDDEEMIRDVCRAMLEHTGWAVITASDGEEAVELFRQRREEIDCVLLDLSMPRKDGLSALSELLQIDPNTKIVLSSGYDDQDATGRFSNLGLAGFIQKPYEMDKLRAALGALVAKAE